MIKWIFVLIFVFINSSLAAQAESFGLGIGVGDPTGLTGKYEWSDQAVDAFIGWPDGELYVHADYLWQKHEFHIEAVPFGVHFGLGARYRQADDNNNRNDNRDDEDNEDRLGVRLPLGIYHKFNGVPIEAFGELALIMDIVPETATDLDFTIGARYFF